MPDAFLKHLRINFGLTFPVGVLLLVLLQVLHSVPKEIVPGTFQTPVMWLH